MIQWFKVHLNKNSGGQIELEERFAVQSVLIFPFLPIQVLFWI